MSNGYYNEGEFRREEEFESRSGERGLLATVVGGAAGAYGGSKLGGRHSTLGGIAGAVGGAFVANELEDKWEEHEARKHYREDFAREEYAREEFGGARQYGGPIGGGYREETIIRETPGFGPIGGGYDEIREERFSRPMGGFQEEIREERFGGGPVGGYQETIYRQDGYGGPIGGGGFEEVREERFGNGGFQETRYEEGYNNRW